MPGHEAGQLADRVALGLVAQRAAKQRERALVEEAREWIEPLPGEARAKLRREVGRVGKSGDLDLILDVEKRLLSDELEHEVAAPGQATALENSMRDLDIAADLVRKVRDPQIVRGGRGRSSSRPEQGPQRRPLDEARQFFKSHVNRLNRAESALGQGDAARSSCWAFAQERHRCPQALPSAQARAMGLSPPSPQSGQGAGAVSADCGE